ncbi:MAG: hypothetical protein MI923_30035 [Phycisphaerales bacterium]|nr:hypothetical protein [Phycisphaerales bacterium]
MVGTNRFRDRFLFALGVTLACCLASPSTAQELTDDMVGQNARAWQDWTAAMRAVERNETAEAGIRLDAIGAMNLSDLRLALMADRTGTLGLEQWAEKDDAPDNVKGVVTKIQNGRRQKALAEDGWHYAAVGRFRYADAAFKALHEANPDPVALLELARRNPNRHDILLKLINHAEVGPAARRFLDILGRGEELLRTDPHEIVANIEKLGGPPRMVYNATNRLKVSGEYAIPHLIQGLQDSGRSHLHPAIIQVIPKIGRDALNPLCIALGMEDNVTKVILIRAAAEIGYKQVVPYLVKLAQDPKQSGDVRATANQALTAFGVSANDDLSKLFYQLSDNYYRNIDSLQADGRSDFANIWYLRGNELRYIPVPRAIFNDVMAMRASEEALIANSNLEEATAQWLAANIRREAKLGLNVESDQPDELANKDSTRPENYPRSIYFSRAAGAKYNHMVLAIAYRDRDPGVALGAIAALRETAGEPSLVGAEDLKQPLVQTLNFPNRQVRVKAALALGQALPATPFSGSENVIPVLSEALVQSDRQAVLIVDPDDNLRNKFQALLRAAGFECAVGSNLYQGLQNGRESNLTTFDVILLGSDIDQPDVTAAINEVRGNFESAATPILIVAKDGDIGRAGRIARNFAGVEIVDAIVVDLGDPDRIKEQVTTRIARASQALGMSPLDRDLSLTLALHSSEVLRDIAESNLSVYKFARAVPSLITALKSKSETLRTKVAHALALAESADAQAAIAESAFDTAHSQAERIAAFGALAESARRNGNLLGDHDVVARLITFTMNEQDLVLRAAASKALGALDLPSNKASEIIREQYNG